MPALTGNSQAAVEGVRHLGYPDYFRTMLTIFKVICALVLILPIVSRRVKEWAYVGFAITMISAFVSYAAVDGMVPLLLLPVIFLGILLASFFTLQKIGLERKPESQRDLFAKSMIA